MAAFDASAWLGARSVRPSETELAELGRVGPALLNVNLENMLRHMHYVPIQLGVHSTVNNATVQGLAVPMVVPVKVVGFSAGCESAAGSAATVDLHKSAAAAPTSFATMLEAPVDVQTDVGYAQPGEITDGEEDLAIGDFLRLEAIGTGPGAVVGIVGIAHTFRL